MQGPMATIALYIRGMYHQGMGDLDIALQVFRDPKFDITTPSGPLSTVRQVEHDLSLLAALNTLWILQEPRHLDKDRNAEIIANLKDMCSNHHNEDLRAAFHVAAACIETPRSGLEIKSQLSNALIYAQKRQNVHFICITLVMMSSSFFTGVLGEQAEKSALSAAMQAKKTGNKLWIGVADGLLANCLQVNGKTTEAEAKRREAQVHAQNSGLPGP